MCRNWFPMKELSPHFILERLCPDCLKFCKHQDAEELDFFRKIDEIRDPKTSDKRRKEIFDEFTGDNKKCQHTRRRSHEL